MPNNWFSLLVFLTWDTLLRQCLTFHRELVRWWAVYIISSSSFQLLYCLFLDWLKASLHFFFIQVSSVTRKLPSSLKQTLDLTINLELPQFFQPLNASVSFEVSCPYSCKNHKKIKAASTDVCTHTHIYAHAPVRVQKMMLNWWCQNILKKDLCYLFLWINFQLKKIKPTGYKN